MSVSEMHQSAVVVKEEPGWSLPAGSCGVSEAAARAGLYTDHEVKDELVVGPERLQPRDAVYTLPPCIKEESELVKVVEHPQEVADWMVDKMESVKVEPSCSENIAACGVSVAAAWAGLYAGHTVKDELVLGPEHLQRPDVANLLNAPGMHQAEVVVKEEPGWSLPAGSCGVSEAAARAGLYTDHEVKDELVVGPERLQPRDAVYTLPVSGVGARSSPRPAPSPSTHTARTHTTPAHNTTRGTALSGHTPAHRKKGHACRVCGKEFQYQSKLQRHERIHTGEKPYSCGICSKKFTQQVSLKSHELIHTGEKPLYSCGVCSKEFTYQSSLKIHERIHTGDKPYSCGVCSKKFARQDYLKMHERIHTGEKPYYCGVCSKEFTQQAGLKNHERIHSGEKPYSCKTCKKKFPAISALRRHEGIHTGHKPYSCDMCGKRFSLKGHLVKHIQRHARKERSAKTKAKLFYYI